MKTPSPSLITLTLCPSAALEETLAEDPRGVVAADQTASVADLEAMVRANWAAIKDVAGVRAVVVLPDLPALDELSLRAKETGIEVVRLETPLPDRQQIGDMIRREKDTPYVVLLEEADRLTPGALAHLLTRLENRNSLGELPDLLVLNQAHWLSDPQTVLPHPDAAAMAALPTGRKGPNLEDLMRLLPDPQRLIRRDAGPNTANGWQNPHAGWPVYEAQLQDAQSLLVLRRPLVLRRWRPAAVISGLASLADSRGKAQTRRLIWLDYALPHCDAAEAEAILAAAETALLGLTTPTADVDPTHQPAQHLLRVLGREGRTAGRAALALILSAQQARHSQALAQSYAALRRDLDLALPGPQYLRDLHARLRQL